MQAMRALAGQVPLTGSFRYLAQRSTPPVAETAGRPSTDDPRRALNSPSPHGGAG